MLLPRVAGLKDLADNCATLSLTTKMENCSDYIGILLNNDNSIIKLLVNQRNYTQPNNVYTIVNTIFNRIRKDLNLDTNKSNHQLGVFNIGQDTDPKWDDNGSKQAQLTRGYISMRNTGHNTLENNKYFSNNNFCLKLDGLETVFNSIASIK